MESEDELRQALHKLAELDINTIENLEDKIFREELERTLSIMKTREKEVEKHV